MMKEYKLFGYPVEIDKEATKDWYYTFKGWRCDCGHCQNFLLLAKKKELPNAVLDTLIAFGVLPEKPTYVCEIASEEGQILYQFSYRMAGNILEEKEESAVEPEWGEARCCHEIYPYGAPGFPEPHFDLEFWVRLPWILIYSFSDIADYLMHGREIEFIYKGRECAITNHTNRWWFYDGVDQVEVCVIKKVSAKAVDKDKASDVYIVAKDFSWTYVRTHETGWCGPYFCRL